MDKRRKILSRITKIVAMCFVVALLVIMVPSGIRAGEITGETEATTSDASDKLTIGISAGDGSDLASVLQILLVLTVIALAPSILIMLTSFTRIIIVMHFTRAALGTQSAPPNQVLIGLSLFLTFFIMAPTFNQVYNDAIKPLSNNEISAEEAYDKGIEPLREFMFKQTNTKDIKMFLEIADIQDVKEYDDIPTYVLIPSFIVSELRISFIIGFLIYIPFIIYLGLLEY